MVWHRIWLMSKCFDAESFYMKDKYFVRFNFFISNVIVKTFMYIWHFSIIQRVSSVFYCWLYYELLFLAHLLHFYAVLCNHFI